MSRGGQKGPKLRLQVVDAAQWVITIHRHCTGVVTHSAGQHPGGERDLVAT
jgi:hypothetical protein